jgi:L-threonylcarbamoyladenylate synthase
MHQDIQKALEVLQNGGTILYPTDTIWGLGCDATNLIAVAKLYEIKKRVDTKSMLVLLDNENRLTQYVQTVPDAAWELIDVADKPLTIIYPGAKNLAENLPANDGSIGIRITNDEFCQKLIQKLKKPIVSTSANISGKPAPTVCAEIEQEILNAVDYAVAWRQDDLAINPPSSIIKIDEKNRICILRE